MDDGENTEDCMERESPRESVLKTTENCSEFCRRSSEEEGFIAIAGDVVRGADVRRLDGLELLSAFDFRLSLLSSEVSPSLLSFLLLLEEEQEEKEEGKARAQLHA